MGVDIFVVPGVVLSPCLKMSPGPYATFDGVTLALDSSAVRRNGRAMGQRTSSEVSTVAPAEFLRMTLYATPSSRNSPFAAVPLELSVSGFELALVPASASSAVGNDLMRSLEVGLRNSIVPDASGEPDESKNCW